MKVPLSWLKDFVDIDLPLLDLASTLTMVGLEVDELQVIGLPMPVVQQTPSGDRAQANRQRVKLSGLSWDPDKIVVARIDEVMPHPNADRLVLCRLNDGAQEIIVLTGAPNLYPYKGQGLLPRPLKVAYAREGARIYDGHQPGQMLTTLKRAKIRGIESFSMVCSEKELGISDEHEGVIILDDDAPTGVPLADYMGDAVFDISITPNMTRNACVLGVARELAAVTGKTLRKPAPVLAADGPSIAGQAAIQITNPELNPRFVLGLVRDVTPQPSPYLVQRRLRLAGMRPINSIVDATNYVMLEIGQPLHAFDYDVMVARAGGKPPTIITRQAHPGERLTTLDGVDRPLDSFTELVTDTAGALSIAGVMGGAESEVTEKTRNVLLEGAAWNFINIRRTVGAQKLQSEAGYRFSRGVHPALAEYGVQICIDRMAGWSDGQVAAGLIDEYPLVQVDPCVDITPAYALRLLDIRLTAQEIARLLTRLEFTCRIEDETVHAQTPPIRMDIGEGVVGRADVLEEVARLYGYNNIPITRMADPMPRLRPNPVFEIEERMRDLLVSLGLQELVTFRMTAPEKEARLVPTGAPSREPAYLRIHNPITPERSVMRRSLLASVLEIIERNIRLSDHLAMFEIGPVFLPHPGQELPDEPRHVVIALSGLRHMPAWDIPYPEGSNLDFYDLKGILESILERLHLPGVTYAPAGDPLFHPGQSAVIRSGEAVLGVFGELHPLVKEHYDFGPAPVLAADLDLEALQALAQPYYDTAPVPAFPPVLEDIAVIVDEETTAENVVEAIRKAGGKLLSQVHLFDIYHGEQIGPGKKSMAYSLTYQALDRTLTDSEAAKIRQRIVQALEKELGAKLRS
ncbi:MAG: phenylalanine--tRNA ligase subunit beta [Anaerolineaceae bacterium]